jgi:hypothetical protein
MKRKLNEEELKWCDKGIANIEIEIAWINYQLKYVGLMLDEGLEVNYSKNIKEFKEQKANWEQMKKEKETSMNILQQQIAEGVEVKQVKGGKK